MAADNWTLRICVRCEECGDWLEVCKVSNQEEDALIVSAYPCETCIKWAQDQGYERGREDAASEQNAS
jgi:hypothetical protein